jgi:hypothetical protein
VIRPLLQAAGLLAAASPVVRLVAVAMVYFPDPTLLWLAQAQA